MILDKDDTDPARLRAEVERLRNINKGITVQTRKEVLPEALEEKQRQVDYWGKRAEKAEAEVERLRVTVSAFANKIEKLAFDMPSPNEHTPQLVMLVNVVRRALEKKS